VFLVISLTPVTIVISEVKAKDIVVPEVPFILKKIAWCESKGKQFDDDGSVHRGIKNPKDVGRYQINETYHLETSMKFGMDIYSLKGNTEYAIYLYEKNGTQDWNWSKKCWADKTVSEEQWIIRVRSVNL